MESRQTYKWHQSGVKVVRIVACALDPRVGKAYCDSAGDKNHTGGKNF